MLNENLRYARKACGFTQQQIADYLGIKRSSYAYYEIGHTPLPIELLPALCVAFGVSCDWMLTHEVNLESDDELLPSVYEKALPGLARLTPQERSLLLLLRKHDLTGTVAEYAQALAEEKKSDE